jgi:surface protein
MLSPTFSSILCISSFEENKAGKLNKANTPSPTFRPTPSLTLPPTLPPTYRATPFLNECQVKAGCQKTDTIPVTVNGYDFQQFVQNYVKDPNPTSHGSNINCWDVSRVTDMSWAFSSQSEFNDPLDCWDVSQVTNMAFMFYFASSFNQSIGSWNVEQVMDISGMFFYASSFNQPTESWNVTRVTDMTYMFSYASSFNQPIGSWNVEQVTGMKYMFLYASVFNQPIESWNVFTRVTNMYCESRLESRKIEYDTRQYMKVTLTVNRCGTKGLARW